MKKAKAIYAELATAGEWATVTHILPETQRQAEWESIMVEKREGFGVSAWKLEAWGSWR